MMSEIILLNFKNKEMILQFQLENLDREIFMISDVEISDIQLI